MKIKPMRRTLINGGKAQMLDVIDWRGRRVGAIMKIGLYPWAYVTEESAHSYSSHDLRQLAAKLEELEGANN